MAGKRKDGDTEDKITEHRMFFNKEESMELREAYTKAIDENKKSFMFKGETLDIAYANYLISYLKMNGY